ncbi:hypothetical protein CGCVW01_v003554 [Colletotrichum viniferum]|nr:hypothetical protein CGCVW01_v003554 [Colletotrichum viniferum]
MQFKTQFAILAALAPVLQALPVDNGRAAVAREVNDKRAPDDADAAYGIFYANGAGIKAKRDDADAAYGIFYANGAGTKAKRDDADAAYGIFYANGADSKVERDETNVSA